MLGLALSQDGITPATTGSCTAANTTGVAGSVSARTADCVTGVVMVTTTSGLSEAVLVSICGIRLRSQFTCVKVMTTSLPSV